MSQPVDTAQISAFGGQVSKSVVFAIQDASRKSGVDFSYLVKQAAVESSFDPNAKARTSSATGLYQFIQSTWLDMVEKHGEKYGIDVNAPRKELLALRKDPELSSYMAAELANENEASLQANWGGEVGETELYLAHFMGAGGASAFLRANDRSPGMAAADLFPEAARSNRSVFFDGHRARSVAEVYNLFDQKFERYDAGMGELMAAIEAVEREGGRAFGAALPGGEGLVARVRNLTQLGTLVEGDASKRLKELDVTLLHEIIFGQLLGLTGHDFFDYTREPAEAVAAVDNGSPAAFLMNPPTVADMKDIALGGEKMPQKSTFYYPKILSGLVLWSLNDF